MDKYCLNSGIVVRKKSIFAFFLILMISIGFLYGSGGMPAMAEDIYNIEVVKEWDDSGMTRMRPDDVTITLNGVPLKDSSASGSVTLSVSDDWASKIIEGVKLEYDDNGRTVMKYGVTETTSDEEKYNAYEPEVKYEESWDWDYPENTFKGTLPSSPAVRTTPKLLESGQPWKINQGIYSDLIEVDSNTLGLRRDINFNDYLSKENRSIYFKEYYANGTEVTNSSDREFKVEDLPEGSYDFNANNWGVMVVWYPKNQALTYQGAVYTDHYFEITFPKVLYLNSYDKSIGHLPYKDLVLRVKLKGVYIQNVDRTKGELTDNRANGSAQVIMKVGRQTMTMGIGSLLSSKLKNPSYSPGNRKWLYQHFLGCTNTEFYISVNDDGYYNMLIPLRDIDIYQNYTHASSTEFILTRTKDVVDNVIYTPVLDWSGTKPKTQYTEFSLSNFSVTNGSELTVAARQILKNDDSGTFNSGFIGKFNINSDGALIQHQSGNYGTLLFGNYKPYYILRVTVDEKVEGYTGGTASEVHYDQFRNFGEEKLIKLIPEERHHISYLKIDEKLVDLTAFNDNGILTITTGWDKYGNGELEDVADDVDEPEDDPEDPEAPEDPEDPETGTNDGTEDGSKGLTAKASTVNTETITLYQLPNGEIDVYLPKQFVASSVTGSSTNLVDHWIDVSFEPNLTMKYTITNVLDNTTEIHGHKTWIDGGKSHDNTQDLALPLVRKSDAPGAKMEPVTILPTWSNDGYYHYFNLEKYEYPGYEYEYTVTETNKLNTEENPNLYDEPQKDTRDPEGYSFINTLKQVFIDIEGDKIWEDGSAVHVNGENVNLKLTRTSAKDNHNAVDDKFTATATWTQDNHFIFSQLPKYDDDRYEYKYTITEVGILDGFESSAEQNSDGTWRIINKRKPGEIIIQGTKTWIDGGREHNYQSDLTLKVTRQSAKPGAPIEDDFLYKVDWNGFIYTISGPDAEHPLPKYDIRNGGYEYTYTVTETVNLDGYEQSVDSTGYNFTNTLKQEWLNFEGTKTWLKDCGIEHDNPHEVELTISRRHKGTEEEWKELDDQETWDGDNYKFTRDPGFPKYDVDRYEYEYKIEEEKIDGYETTKTCSSKGCDFVNELKQVKVLVSGTKTWIDGWHNHDNRNDIQLSLKRVSSKPGSIEEDLKDYAHWTGVLFEFPTQYLYDSQGCEYIYSVVEELNIENKDDYEIIYADPVYEESVIVDGESITGITIDITNRIKQEYIELYGTKTWLNDGNIDHDNDRELTLVLTRKSLKPGSEKENVRDPLTGGNYKPSWEGNGNTYTYKCAIEDGSCPLVKYDIETGYEYRYFVEETGASYFKKETTCPTDGCIEGHCCDFVNTVTDNEIYIDGYKFWNDGKDDHYEPRDLRLTLKSSYLDGTNENVVKDAHYTWEGNHYYYGILPRYENNGTGSELKYWVEEENLLTDANRYTIVQDGTNFTNIKYYYVDHSFISGTPGKNLPDELIALRPDRITNLLSGESAEPGNDFTKNYPVPDGVWNFIGWDKDSVTITDHDEEFIGTWVFTSSYPQKTWGENTAAGANGANVYINDLITYEVKYQNYRDCDNATVTITDQLQSGLKYISSSDNGYEYNNQVTWVLSGIGAGAKGSVTLTVQVLDSARNIIPNQANVRVQCPNQPTVPDDSTPSIDNPLRYKVTYQFVSDDPIRELPDEIKLWIPDTEDGYKPDDVVAPNEDFDHTYEVSDGTWTFDHWNAASKTITDHDEEFIGTWIFTSKYPTKTWDADSDKGKEGAAVYLDDVLTYRIEYRNTKSSRVHVIVTDELANGVEYAGVKQGDPLPDNGCSNNVCKWERNLAAGELISVSIKVKLVSTVTDILTNRAYVNVDGVDEPTTNIDNPIRYKVFHHFVSGDDSMTLPEAVLSLVPGDQEGKSNGDTVFPTDPRSTTVPVDLGNGIMGYWEFQGWDVDSQIIDHTDAHFYGTWIFKRINAIKEFDENSAAGKDYAPVYSGDMVTYKITYKNWENKNVRVTITDSLPAQTAWKNCSEGGDYNRDSHTCMWIKDVSANGSVSVTVTVQVLEGDALQIKNRAYITDGEGNELNPPALINNINFKVTHKFESLNPDLKALPEEIILWTPESKDGYTSGDTAYPTDFTPKSKYIDGIGTWEFVEWDANSKVIDTADVEFIGYWDFIPDKPGKDVSEGTFKYEDGVVYVGDEITYQIRYINYLDDTATITVTDQLPDNAELVRTNPDYKSYVDGLVTWEIPGVAKETSGTVSLTIRVTAGKSSSISNKATIHVPGYTPISTPEKKVDHKYKVTHEFKSITPGMEQLPKEIDPGRVPGERTGFEDGNTVRPTELDEGNKTLKTAAGTWEFISWDATSKVIDGDDVTFIGTWRFIPNTMPKVITRTVLAERANVAYIGDRITYEIRYTNWTDDEADIKVMDELPMGTILYEASEPYSYENGIVTWRIEKVGAGKSGSVWLTVTLASGVSAPVENQAYVHVGDYDPIPTDKPEFPVEYRKTHTFVSGTEDKEIPEEFNKWLPDVETGLHNGDTVRRGDTSTTEFRDETGTWTFIGWDKDEDTVHNDDVVFTGTWTYQQDPPEKKVSERSEAGINVAEVDVDDIVTYEIRYANWLDKEAIVVISDNVPESSEFVDADHDGQESAGIVRWELTVPKRTWGTVNMRVRVIGNVTHQLINNATVIVGGHTPEQTLTVENHIKEYTVYHEFISGSGMELPQEVLDLLPGDQTGLYNHDTVYPSDLEKTVVPVSGGKWVFRGWDAGSKVIDGEDVTFVGTWVYEPDRVVPPFFPIIPDKELPATGFSTHDAVAVNRPLDVKAYEPLDMVLTIPAMGIEIELVNLAMEGNTWPVYDLGNRGGVLEGYAKPGEGYSLIAGHNTLSKTQLGPFAKLPEIKPGDVIAVRDAYGRTQMFSVYANELVEPNGFEQIASIAEQAANSLMLVTCENESAKGGYLNRRVVFAKPLGE